MYLYITTISGLTHAKSGVSLCAIARAVLCNIHDGARRVWQEVDKGRENDEGSGKCF
jgi:hypothetical protein